MDNDIENQKGFLYSTNKPIPDKNTILLIIIAVLLFVILILNAVQLISRPAKEISTDISLERTSAIEAANKLLSAQQPIVTALESDYRNNVYDNPRVDNINKQLLMSQEFSFITLQLIAEQNLHIIELLSTLD